MAKNIIKEIIIMLLLCLAIMLVLGVLLYEYVPSNKIIPDEVSYTAPENIKEELSKSDDVDNDNVILTYSINSSDLNNYQKIKTYVPGKQNPFSDGTSSNQQGNNNQSNSNNTNSGNNNSSNSNNNSSNNDTNNSNTGNNTTGSTTNNSGYLPDKGTK